MTKVLLLQGKETLPEALQKRIKKLEQEGLFEFISQGTADLTLNFNRSMAVDGFRLEITELPVLKAFLHRASTVDCQFGTFRAKIPLDIKSFEGAEKAVWIRLAFLMEKALKTLNQRNLELPEILKPYGKTSVVKTFLAKSFWFCKKVKNKLSSLFLTEKWVLKLVYKNKSKILGPKNKDFWADPFLYRSNGRDYVFFEEYLAPLKKGVISVFELKPHLKQTEVVRVLDLPYHLSYPFLFEYKSQLYMIPETGENKTIEIYRCNEFPGSWTLEKTIFKGTKAVDSTLCFYQGLWWLFTNQADDERDCSWDSLYLYFSDSPFSTSWKPHPQNPIVMDVGRARPAGHLRFEENKIIRPAQDCSKKYGGATVLNEIKLWTTQEYFEEPIKTISNTHTYNTLEDWKAEDTLKKYWKAALK